MRIKTQAECFCGKKYQYRRSYTKHINNCLIYQREIKKPLNIGDYGKMNKLVMEAINEEAKQVLELVQ